MKCFPQAPEALNPVKCFQIEEHYSHIINAVKPVLSGNSKIDKTKVFMANGSILQYFDLH